MNILNKLEVKNITKSFDGTETIKNITLNLKEEETVSLLGISGIGKTTLFNVIAGITLPDSGNIILNSEDITGKTGKIAYMLQKDLLLPYKTIIDNITLPLIIKGVKKAEAVKKGMELLAPFGISGYDKKYPNELSGGMRQRAALLRTYLWDSPVMLLDEPFSALDAKTKKEMHKWFLELKAKMKFSAIFITHDISEAINLSDRIFIMANTPGEIVKEFNSSQENELKNEIIKYF